MFYVKFCEHCPSSKTSPTTQSSTGEVSQLGQSQAPVSLSINNTNDLCFSAACTTLHQITLPLKETEKNLIIMNEPSSSSGTTSTVAKFPSKLHFVLSELRKDGLEDIASWQPHGRCFLVHKPKELETRILPFYFQQSKFTSFQRQLSFYGFRRITTGADKGGYYHAMFVRGQEMLASRIQRTKIKGTTQKISEGLELATPDFYSMLPIPNDCGSSNPHPVEGNPSNRTISNIDTSRDPLMIGRASYGGNSSENASRGTCNTSRNNNHPFLQDLRHTLPRSTILSMLLEPAIVAPTSSSENILRSNATELEQMGLFTTNNNNGFHHATAGVCGGIDVSSIRSRANTNHNSAELLRIIETAQSIADQNTANALISQHQATVLSNAYEAIAQGNAILQLLRNSNNDNNI